MELDRILDGLFFYFLFSFNVNDDTESSLARSSRISTCIELCFGYNIWALFLLVMLDGNHRCNIHRRPTYMQEDNPFMLISVTT